jgi:hypothetical protein
LPPVEGEAAAAAPQKPAGGKNTGKDALPPVEGDWDALPDAEKAKVFDDYAATYGEPPAPDNDEFVADAKKWWRSNKKPAAGTKPAPAASSTPAAKDKLPPVEGDGAAKADASKPKTDASPDAKKPKSDTANSGGSKSSEPEPTKRKGFLDRYRVAGGLLLAAGVPAWLAKIGRQGGGGGGQDGGDGAPSDDLGKRIPVPPVGGAESLDASLLSEEEIAQRLDRIRGSRGPQRSQPYQTLQNWDYWSSPQ